jgi:hypothetical protein
MEISSTPNDDLVSEQIAAEANTPENLRRHRIILRRPSAATAISIGRFAGKLRHELEHARQWQACGPPVAHLSEIADRVLQRKLKGLAGGNVFTNLKPNEQDANAALAVYLRTRWPKAIPELLEDREDAPLARSLTPPGSPETLVKRMIAFLYLFEDLCREEAKSWPFGFGDFLNEVAPGSRDLWETLSATSIAGYWPSPPRVPSDSRAENSWRVR